MIAEPWFYVAAAVAVLIVGIAKGGLGGGIGIVGVPLMALFVSPAQAAAILLPILMVMDALAGLDQVAYVRFASVYRNFREAKDFETFVEQLGGVEDAPSEVD